MTLHEDSKLRSNKSSGQAILEYILMTLVALSFIAILTTGFRRTVISVWEFYSKRISAPCPTGCPADPSVRIR